MWKRIDVGGVPVGIVHGDAQSLAGWGFAPEHLRQAEYLEQARKWFSASGVRIFACSHTCSPVLLPLSDTDGRNCLVANNGAAGMPNFSGVLQGLLTRIATTPHSPSHALHCAQLDGLYIEAQPIVYDHARWQTEFLQQWPAGSPAYASYWQRITHGPTYQIAQAYQEPVCEL
jgi:hypothetical protein